MKLNKGSFVTVIGQANLTTGDSEILYVNPTTTSIEPDASAKRSSELELVVYDAAGSALLRTHPVVRIPASVPLNGPVPPNTIGLIHEDLPQAAGMDSIALLHNGHEKARFKAGGTGTPSAGVTFGPAAPGSGNRLTASASGVSEEAGVTYTVLVQKEGDQHWNTIAVGKKRPDFELDRNQFPGAKKVKVKVLRNTGFAQTELSEQDVDLDY
jgi:hypothetical protein